MNTFGLHSCEACGRDFVADSEESKRVGKPYCSTLNVGDNPNWVCDYCGHDNNPAPGRSSLMAQRIAEKKKDNAKAH